MFPIPEQFSAATKSHIEAQLKLLSTVTSKALDSAEKIIALNISVSKAAVDKSSSAVKQLFAAKDPSEFLALSASQARPDLDNALAYSRQLLSIASGAQAGLIASATGQVKEQVKVSTPLLEQTAKAAPVVAKPAAPEVKAEVKPAAITEAKAAEVKAEAKAAEVKPAVKPAVKAEVKAAEVKPEVKPAVKAEAKAAEAKPEVKAEAKAAQVKPEAKPEVKAEAKAAEVKPVAAPQAPAKPEPAANVASKVAAKPAAASVPVAAAAAPALKPVTPEAVAAPVVKVAPPAKVKPEVAPKPANRPPAKH